MVLLTEELWFPDPAKSTADGLIAIGGDLAPERLLLAYHNGIFPWFRKDGYPFWFCPPERMVLFPQEIYISTSMKKILRSGKFRVTEDTVFEEVIRSCASVHEANEFDTWIDDEFIKAYIELYRLGHAHSIEVWQGGELVGGMYGVAVGKVFCGESMFSRVPNASKIALVHFSLNKKYSLLDCQVPTDHLASMGARIISRKKFLELLKNFSARV